MSTVYSYAVGNGDMFSIKHGVDSFTIIDCSLSPDNKKEILRALKIQASGKEVSRFISTHPDQDHILGLRYLNSEMPISNFYCVKNNATKAEVTDDFNQYRKLKEGDNAFYISKGCKRKWLNDFDEDRGGAGINFLWPDVKNTDFIAALHGAENGNSPNNISPIIKYSIENSGSFLWLGDLETEFMKKVENSVKWPKIDILFAPHHGRDSGKIPESILLTLDPGIIIIGEAPSEHLNYYRKYNTITQNSAGTIEFECVNGYIHIFVSNAGYSVDFLSNFSNSSGKNYIGTLEV